MSRTFDIIVNGATGYTGTLIAEYIATRNPSLAPIKSWAISGRDEGKLKALRDKLTNLNSKLKDLPYLVVNSTNEADIVNLVKQTKVLINCVGPFVKYGEPVVRACVQTGTHYVDITGEPGFIKDVIAKHDQTAREKNVLVIPAAGFDSVPADMGVFFTEKRKSKNQLKQVEAFIASHGGGLSYGTYNTIIESLSTRTPQTLSRKNEEGKKKPRNIQKLVPYFSPLVNSWVFPFNFTSDPFVVTRSRRLMDREYFSFGEYLELQNFFYAFFLGVGLFIFFLIVKIPGGANFLRSLRKEGSGPSEEVRKTSSTSARFFGEDIEGNKVSARYTGPEAYTATAIFVTEAAQTIIRHHDNLPQKGGVSTPAAALGDKYIDDLTATGVIKFE